MAVILINTTNRNIWIHQPVLAADVYDVELHPLQYHTVLQRERKTTNVEFQPIVPPDVEGSLQANQLEAKVKEGLSEEESAPPLPSCGPHPDTNKDYNFEDEVARLPFKSNLGEAPFSKE